MELQMQQIQHYVNEQEKHIWWDDKCEGALQERERKWQIWHSNNTIENQEEYKQVRNTTAKLTQNKKRKYEIERQLELIEENFKKNNNKDFHT